MRIRIKNPILLVIIVALGVIIALVIRRTYVDQAAVKDWPSTQGEITVSEMQTRPNGKASHRLRYIYSVSGVAHEGTRISFTEVHGIGSDYLNEYPKGATPTVYYDPEDPANAVLEREDRNRMLYLALFFGALFAIVIFSQIQIRRG